MGGGGYINTTGVLKCVCISTVTYLRGHTVVRRGHIQLRTWSATSSMTRRDLVCVWGGGGVHKYNSIIKCTQVCMHSYRNLLERSHCGLEGSHSVEDVARHDQHDQERPGVWGVGGGDLGCT